MLPLKYTDIEHKEYKNIIQNPPKSLRAKLANNVAF
jgi:hypothetical protein